jgi:hypothetical protein
VCKFQAISELEHRSLPDSHIVAIVRTGRGPNTDTTRYLGRAGYVWNNTGDTAYLRTPSGALMDSCKWTRTAPGYKYCLSHRPEATGTCGSARAVSPHRPIAAAVRFPREPPARVAGHRHSGIRFSQGWSAELR